MKLFLLLLAVVFAIHHFAGKGGASSSAAKEVPLLFDPAAMSAEQKAEMKVQLGQSLVEIDEFIANPPVIL